MKEDHDMTTGSILDLIRKARKARKRAYAPYSGYKVGAALLAKDGRVFTGVNVENASYGLTICAERNAIAAAVAAGATEFKAIAVVADSKKAFPSPCGACRQVLSEFAPKLDVYLAGLKGPAKRFRLDELLPGSFRLEKRKKKI